MLSFRQRRLQVRPSAALAASCGVHWRVIRPCAGPDSAVGVVDSARTGCSAAESAGRTGGTARDRRAVVGCRSRSVAFIAVVAGKQTPKPVTHLGLLRAPKGRPK